MNSANLNTFSNFYLSQHISGSVGFIQMSYLIGSFSWRRHQMEIFSALLDLLSGIHQSPVSSLHKGQWRWVLMFPVICALNKRLSKQSWGRFFETPTGSLWRHCNVSLISPYWRQICIKTFTYMYGGYNQNWWMCIHLDWYLYSKVINPHNWYINI